MSSSHITISQFLAKEEQEGNGDVVLTCEDGEIKGIRGVILSLASPVIAGALECVKVNGKHQIEVEGSVESWLSILVQLYPVPLLSGPAAGDMESIQMIAEILPLLHKYDIIILLERYLAILCTKLPACLNSDARSPGYSIYWLTLGDDLQFEDIKKMALEKIEALANSKLHAPAFISNPSSVVPINPPKPAKCVYACQPNHINCSKWCTGCKAWCCCEYPGIHGVCPHHQRHGTLLDTPPRASEPPMLLPSIKELSSEMKDKILTILIAAAASK